MRGILGLVCITLAGGACGGASERPPSDAVGTDASGVDGSSRDAVVSDATPSDATSADAVALPDAAYDGDPAIDSDGDTVTDDIDNCPQVDNLEQHDKDGDHVGDVCDPCPHLDGVTGADIDDDGDGVGNGCDPRNGMPDTAEFYGFYPAFDPSSWQQDPVGLWSVGAGGLLQQDDTVYRARITTPVTVTDSRITIGARGISTPDGAFGIVGVFARVTPTGDEEGCVADVPPVNVPYIGYVATFMGGGYFNSAPWWDGGLVGQRITLAVDLHGTSFSCEIETEPTGTPSASLANDTFAFEGLVALEMTNLAAEVTYLHIVHYGP